MRKPPALYRHLALLGDPLRGRMLLLLERSELTVGELCAVLQTPQSTASRHLKALSDASWLTARSEGTNRSYTIAGGVDPSARALWQLVRKEAAATAAAESDARRLEQVLADRRSRSQEFFRAGAGSWDSVRDELFGRRFFLPALLALLDDRMVVGDLGCGTGPIAATLAPYVAKVVGVDESPAMLRGAARRLAGATNVELKRGTLEALPLDDASLDAATMVLVLHHVPEPARALREAARVLRPGGRLVLVDMLPHDREEYRARMGHVWLGFGAADVLRLLAEEGFEGVGVHPLPADPKAKGPALFAGRALRARAASGRSHTRRLAR